MTEPRFWSAHTHSKYSEHDALPEVSSCVDVAEAFEYPALGLTDHGNTAGAVQLYTACRKAGIKPLPGFEAYVHLRRPTSKSSQTKSMHMGLLATSTVGYRNLVGLVTQSNKNFFNKPILDLPDLAEAGRDGRLEGIAAMTGCWFGILPTLLREGDVHAVRNLLLGMNSWFGSGLYVEMQNHKIPDQDDEGHVAVLHELAHMLSLPVVITQDSHYTHAHHRADHDMMKSLYSWSKDPDDALFPGDGYHMVDVEWMRGRFTDKQLADGLDGLDHLARLADVTIPELDTFKLAVPDTGINPDLRLTEQAVKGFTRLVDEGHINKSSIALYEQRMNEELDVVINAGFSGYLLLTQTVCEYMRSENIMFGVRGSAVGSALCWFLGITSLDPIVWELPFDRFLSRDRTKPPDIDLDIEHLRRDDVMEWIGQRHHTVRIGSWSKMRLRTDGDSEKGTLIERWKQRNRKLGQPNTRLEGEELQQLRSLAKFEAYFAHGTHAAGLMITPDEATASCVPLMWSTSSKALVSSFDMGDIERLGLVKLDLLSVRTMTALKIATEMSGVRLEEIPFDDADTFDLIRSREPAGLFQLEGVALSYGLKQLQPQRFQDLVAAIALFRPQGIKSGNTKTYLSRRKGKEEIPQHHELIMNETRETYGVVLYQEQVLNIVKKLGLTVEDMERVRKAVKSSNNNVEAARKTIEEMQEKIELLGRQAGMNESDIEWMREGLNAYAEYGFNKSHSVSYAVIAYFTAYMRANYPTEFWLGMLVAYQDDTKEVWYGKGPTRSEIPIGKAYSYAAMEDGVKILAPHVNKSKESWSYDEENDALRPGLASVKGIKKSAAVLVKHQPYASLDDMAERIHSGVDGIRSLGEGHHPEACGGAVKALHEAGALSGLGRDPAAESKREEIRAEKERKAREAFARRVEKEYLILSKSTVAAYETSEGIKLKRTHKSALVQALLAWYQGEGAASLTSPLDATESESAFIAHWIKENT